MLHNIVINNRKVYLKNPRFVQGGINADEIVVFPDEEWEECDTILVTFDNKSMEAPITYLLPGTKSSMLVPKLALEKSGDLYISFTGYVGEEKRLTTQKMSHVHCGKVVTSGVIAEEGEDSHPDDLDYLASLIQEVNDILEKLEEGGYGGTMDYLMLLNLPSIEGVVLKGNKLLSDFGLGSISGEDIDTATTE